MSRDALAQVLKQLFVLKTNTTMIIYIMKAHVIVPVFLAIMTNMLIYGLKWNTKDSTSANTLLPPGIIIGVIWIAIFAVLGAVHYLVRKDAPTRAWAIVFLIAFCLAYPFMTLGLKTNTWSAFLNLLTLVISFTVALIIPRKYVAYMLPVILWATYVNIAQIIMCNNNPQKQ